MSITSKIEWTEATWNPITGCTKCSAGCEHCYAATLAKRLHAMGNIRYTNGFKVTVHRDLFERPLTWTKPKMIFVNSMSDIFHEDVADEDILKIFETMTDEWLDFIAQCRAGLEHEYDVVEGPMADDTIWNYVEEFLAGNISRAAFWELAKFRYPTHQIVFCTEKSLQTLKFLRSYEV